MVSEGDTSEGDEGDPKNGEDAIGGEFFSGVRSKTLTTELDWGVISSRDVSDLSEVRGSKVLSPKIGEISSAGGFVDFRCDFKEGKVAKPKSIKEGSPKGDGGIGRSEYDREGGSHGRRNSESELSFQQSYCKKVSKEEGAFIVQHRPEGVVGGGHPECFSVFVGNIPVSLSPWRLKRIFKEFGDVTDVFISQKSSKIYNSRFAFVRFKSRVEADRAIQGMDGAEIEGQSLVVNVARFSRAESMMHHKSLNASDNIKCTEDMKLCSKVSGGLSYAQVVQRSEDHTGGYPLVRRKISISSGNLDWLSSSLVGTLRVGLEFGRVKNILIDLSDMVKEVSFLGGCRVLVIFSSVNSRNEALKDPAWNMWFFSMEPWKAESVGGPQRLWITCVGVPITAWNAEFFALLGKQWGRLIDVDEETLNRSQFVQACLLIESNYGAIDESIDLDVDGVSYILQVSSSPQSGLMDAQRGNSLRERGREVSGEKSNSQCVDHTKVMEQVELFKNKCCGSQEKIGLQLSNASNSCAGMSCYDVQLAAGNEMGLPADITPVLFGFVEEGAIRILDEDSGCLTRISGNETVCRHALNESEISGSNNSARVSVESGLKVNFQRMTMEVSRKPSHSDPEEGINSNIVKEVVSGIAGKSGTPLGLIAVDLSNGSTVDGHALVGMPVSCSAGVKSERDILLEKETEVEKIMALKDKSIAGVNKRDQTGDKIVVESGGAATITVAPLKKFEVTQDFINSSIDITTDVLVECKVQGITISESVQRAIIEAMTKRHIQAEEDFYAESSNGG